MDWLYGGILGIIGTILGTILGYLLNYLSNKGKIIITQNYGYYSKAISWKKDEEYSTDKVIFEFTLEFFNSSNNDVLMQKIELEFLTKDKNMFETPSMRPFVSRQNKAEYDFINIVVKPKELVMYQGYVHISHVDALNLESVNFTYKDKRNKKKTLFLINTDRIKYKENIPPLTE